MPKETIEALVEGGKATPQPPLGPTLAQAKLNIGEVIQKINEKTREFEGMKVPVKIIYDVDTKEFEIKVGVPPVSSLIKKELKIEKVTMYEKEEKPVNEEKKEKKTETKAEKEKPKEKTVLGNLTMEQIIKIAKIKKDDLLAKDLKSAVKEVVGSVVSMQGMVTIENKGPKEILKEIDEGKWDEKIGS
jgi:large subunit ribosomal protein L11